MGENKEYYNKHSFLGKWKDYQNISYTNFDFETFYDYTNHFAKSARRTKMFANIKYTAQSINTFIITQNLARKSASLKTRQMLLRLA